MSTSPPGPAQSFPFTNGWSEPGAGFSRSKPAFDDPTTTTRVSLTFQPFFRRKPAYAGCVDFVPSAPGQRSEKSAEIMPDLDAAMKGIA